MKTASVLLATAIAIPLLSSAPAHADVTQMMSASNPPAESVAILANAGSWDLATKPKPKKIKPKSKKHKTHKRTKHKTHKRPTPKTKRPTDSPLPPEVDIEIPYG